METEAFLNAVVSPWEPWSVEALEARLGWLSVHSYCYCIPLGSCLALAQSNLQNFHLLEFYLVRKKDMHLLGSWVLKSTGVPVIPSTPI